ncbi:hypothetical protein GCM10027614_20100 [Micromonospora vulcania]
MTVVGSSSTDQIQSHVEPAIRALLDRLDPGNRLVAGYQLGYWDADGSPANRQGKGCVRCWHCSRLGPPTPSPGPASRPPPRSSWRTTSRCCTTT